jgi:hypothetical protein
VPIPATAWLAVAADTARPTASRAALTSASPSIPVQIGPRSGFPCSVRRNRKSPLPATIPQRTRRRARNFPATTPPGPTGAVSSSSSVPRRRSSATEPMERMGTTNSSSTRTFENIPSTRRFRLKRSSIVGSWESCAYISYCCIASA